jgi:hypothetical protein
LRDRQRRGALAQCLIKLGLTLEGHMSGNIVAGAPGHGQPPAEVSQEYVVGAGVYWALAGRRVRQEEAQVAAA